MKSSKVAFKENICLKAISLIRDKETQFLTKTTESHVLKVPLTEVHDFEKDLDREIYHEYINK